MSRPPMVGDAVPARDLLNFERYVSPLVDVVTSPSAQTPFTVGIFGSWGTGKSTLMELMDRELDDRERDSGTGYFRIRFNPWVHRDEDNLIVPLLHTVQDHLQADQKGRFLEAAKIVAGAATRLGLAWLIKTASADIVSLKDLEEHQRDYMAQHQRAKSVIRTLKNDFRRVIEDITLKNRGARDRGRVVFFIDDLDRCEPTRVIDLLESLKLFLEQEHCFYFLALDEEVVSRGIQIKYKGFEFAEGRKETIGAEYLDKMIQLPVHLYPLGPSEIQGFLKKLPLRPEIEDQAHELAKVMVPNPRKIKRICNLLTLSLAVRASDQSLAQVVDEAVLGRLVTLQVQDIALYRAIIRFPKLPEYLGKVFEDKIDFSQDADWAEFGEQRDEVRDLCREYLRVGGWVKQLFCSEPAIPSQENLAPYLNMLGRSQAT